MLEHAESGTSQGADGAHCECRQAAFTGVPVFTGGFVFTSGLVFAGMPLVGTVGTSLRTVLAWVAVVSIVIVTVLLVRVRAPVVPVLALVPGVLVMHTRDGTLSSWEAPCRPKTGVGTQQMEWLWGPQG